MIAAALLAAPTSSSSSSSSSSSLLKSSSSTMSTTTTTTTMSTTTTAMKTTEQQVRTLIPVTTSDGSKLFVSGPCIVLKTQTPGPPTVAQQMQALRPLLKADININTTTTTTTTTTDQNKQTHKNDRNNNNNNENNENNVSTSTNTTHTSSIPSKKNSTSSSTSSENEPEPLRCKRRIDFTSLGLPRPQPAAMARRNERERNRVKQVNLGFETLRQHVPQGRKNKKLSKVDTLKEAVKYIRYLHQLLQDADEDADTTAAITDTINLVSRSSPVTTAVTTTTAVATSPRPASTVTSSTVTTSTNTADLSPGEFMDLASTVVVEEVEEEEGEGEGEGDSPTGMDYCSGEGVVDPIPSGSPVELGDVENSSVFKLDSEASDYSPEDLKHRLAQLSHVQDFNNLQQQQQQQQQQHQQQHNHHYHDHHHDHQHHHQQLPQQQQQLSINGSADMGHSSPSNFLELAPAQMTLSGLDPATSPMNAADHHHPGVVGGILLPETDLTTLYTTYTSTLPPSAMTFMTFASSSSSTHSSPESSSSSSSSLKDVSTERRLHPHPHPHPQALRVGQGCRGSEGSCPVSPSQSSGASESPGEECLGVSECETWQDLSADIAEWLCSKIDIDDPEVFV